VKAKTTDQSRDLEARTRCDASSTPLGEIMTTDVTCVRADFPVSALRSVFARESFSGMPVIDDAGRPIGVVSRTDLVRGGTLARGRTVYDLMMPMAFTLPETASIARAAALMAHEGIHRIPVVDASGVIRGIVSTLDISRWVASTAAAAVDPWSDP